MWKHFLKVPNVGWAIQYHGLIGFYRAMDIPPENYFRPSTADFWPPFSIKFDPRFVTYKINSSMTNIYHLYVLTFKRVFFEKKDAKSASVQNFLNFGLLEALGLVRRY